MPGVKIEIVKTDFGYAYVFTLREPDGSLVELNGEETVILRARHVDRSDVVVEKECTISDPDAAEVSYTLGVSDFTVEGPYYGEIEVISDESGDEYKATYQGFTLVVIPKV